MAGNATAEEVYRMILAQVPRLGSSNVGTRREAAEAIYDICFKYEELASHAVVPLVACLDDPDEKVREKAVWALKYCGKPARPHLRKCLSSRNKLIRLHAAKSIGSGRKAGIREKHALRRLLSDDDSDVRSSAAWALSMVGARDSRTISRLREMIDSPLSADRASALHALGNLGRRVDDKSKIRDWFEQVVPALIDSSEDVRWSAYYALGVIKAPVALSLPLWIKGLSDSDEEVVSVALDGFLDIAEEKDLIDAIDVLAAIVDRQVGASQDAGKALATLGVQAKTAVPSLMKALKSDSPHLVAKAAVALWKIDRRVDESLAALANLMKSPGVGVGEVVCDALYRIGRAAAPMTGLVLDMLAIEDYDLQWAAADALGAIAAPDPKAIDSLIGALGHPSGIVCDAAMKALLSIGPNAVPLLVNAIGNKTDGHRREYIADVLGRFGTKAMAASDELKELITDPDTNLRAWCAIALGKVAASSAAVPVLIDTLEHIDGANIRQQAIESLGEIGTAARKAIPILEKFRDDSDEQLRDAAENALARIAS
jgi:HEAT repeat protein